MAHIKDFQKGLFSDVDGLNDNFAFESASSPARGKGSKVVKSSLVEGLDSSILVDPWRLHMTLGVMNLEQDYESVDPTEQPETTQAQGHLPKKTVSSALYLLNSLKPHISEILQFDKGIKVPLEILHVLKTQKIRVNTKGNKGVGGDRKEEASDGRGGSGPYDVMQEKEAIGAGVLYIAPEIKNQDGNVDLLKLIQVSDFVHQTFKDAGYITDTRPLKLHCTILNASNRKPRVRQPFCYSDILESDALRVLREDAVIDQEGDFSSSIQLNPSIFVLPQNISSSSNPSSNPPNVPMKSPEHSVVKNPPSVSVNLGVFIVEEIQLWVMGSHGPDNEYISCGGIVLE